MGIISSKLIRSDSKPSKVSAAVQTETPKPTKEIMDVRSPSAEIVRTPITVDKLSLEKDFLYEYQSYPLQHKLLKSLKLDPRSPTIGIYRTPILIEETPDRATPDKCNTPISIYSCNINDSIVEEIMTPIESYMNVSGFDTPKVTNFDEAVIIKEKEEEVVEKEENKSSLKVSDKPNTDEAKKLLEEIISDEENFLKMKLPKKKNKIIKNDKKSSTGTKTKLRAPLSNITSSTNSPNNINVGVKLNSKSKVLPEFGSENSVTPTAKCMIQWDQNNTVII